MSAANVQGITLVANDFVITGAWLRSLGYERRPTWAMKTFSDKTALVTGASRGIGRAVALGLASAGADLALLARSQPELEEVAEHSRALGARVVVVPTDLADQSALAAAIQHAQNECGVIDILINNAAVVQPMGPTVDVDVAEWAAAITVNLTESSHI